MPHPRTRQDTAEHYMTYKQEYLRGSLSLLASLYMCTGIYIYIYVLTRIDAATVHDERETLCIGFAGQWVVASRPIAPRRFASPRFASLRVTRARCHRGSIYRVRQSAKADLSSSLGLPIYLPTYLSIYLSICRADR